MKSVDTYYYEGGQNMTVLQDQQQVKFGNHHRWFR